MRPHRSDPTGSNRKRNGSRSMRFRRSRLTSVLMATSLAAYATPSAFAQTAPRRQQPPAGGIGHRDRTAGTGRTRRAAAGLVDRWHPSRGPDRRRLHHQPADTGRRRELRPAVRRSRQPAAAQPGPADRQQAARPERHRVRLGLQAAGHVRFGRALHPLPWRVRPGARPRLSKTSSTSSKPTCCCICRSRRRAAWTSRSACTRRRWATR